MTMQVQTKFRKQVATFWSVTPDGFGGDTFGEPVPLKVRWEERQERFRSVNDLHELVSQAVVYVDQDMKVGDYLALGEYTDEDPSALGNKAYKVQRFDDVTDLRSVSTLKRAIL